METVSIAKAVTTVQMATDENLTRKTIMEERE